MSPPPTPGPAICAPETEISSFEFPSTSWSRSTRYGRYDWYATSKKTVKVPTRKLTTYSWGSVRTSNAHARGIVARRTGPAMIADDEDHPPRQPVDPDAGGQREDQEREELDSREARDRERALIEISIAIHGIAIWEIGVPNSLIDCPIQSFMKSR